MASGLAQPCDEGYLNGRCREIDRLRELLKENNKEVVTAT